MSDEKEKAGRIAKLLSEQRRVLTAAGCDRKIIDEYSSLIRFLMSATALELRRIFPEPPDTRKRGAEKPEMPEAEIEHMPTADVERFIGDEGTPRKFLERIAIYRFRVPRGSMRSFSNREMLVDKLITLLRNEQAHETIETVARSQGELRGTRSRE